MKFIITESQHNRLLSEQKVYTSQTEYDKAMTRYEDGLKIYESEKLLKENLTLFGQKKLSYNDLKNFLDDRNEMFNQINQRNNNIFDRAKKQDDILKYFGITENKNNRLLYSFCLGKNGKLIEVNIEKLGKKLKTKKLISNQPCDSFSRFELSDFNTPIKPILNLPPAKSNLSSKPCDCADLGVKVEYFGKYMGFELCKDVNKDSTFGCKNGKKYNTNELIDLKVLKYS